MNPLMTINKTTADHLTTNEIVTDLKVAQTDKPQIPPLYDLVEISQILRVSPKTVYYWVSRHEIPYIKVGRHLRFQIAEVIAFFRSRTRPSKSSLANPSKPL